MQHEMFPHPCPLCHGSGLVPRLPQVTGYIRTRMLDLLIECPNGLTANGLLLALYGKDTEHWPQSDTKIISVLIWHANKQLRPQGYEIKCLWRGGRAGHSPYALVKFDADSKRKPARGKNVAALEGAQSAGTAGLY